MSDREEMLEATLSLVDGGVVILDDRSKVVFWNTAASVITGYLAQDVISRRCPDDLYRLDTGHQGRPGVTSSRLGSSLKSKVYSGTSASEGSAFAGLSAVEFEDQGEGENGDTLRCPTLVSINHKLGHPVPAMLRKELLRDSLGGPTGTALLFYPVEDMDTLPHGEGGECAEVERSQADMEDRLEAAHYQWRAGRMPLGLLWITVDQAAALRQTHGRDACEAMLRTVEHTLLRQMKPGEIIGRWGDNEYLVLAHERTAQLLIEHAQRLAGLARTADFRWWGDRVGLTVSIGTSQASAGETLQSALNRARQAMQASAYAGGNRATESREG